MIFWIYRARTKMISNYQRQFCCFVVAVGLGASTLLLYYSGKKCGVYNELDIVLLLHILYVCVLPILVFVLRILYIVLSLWQTHSRQLHLFQLETIDYIIGGIIILQENVRALYIFMCSTL